MVDASFVPAFPVQALWLMLPAYVSNMVPVVLAKVFPRWNAPLDGGRAREDGTRLLGDGKTWRGLIGGAIIGAVVAVLQAAIPWDGKTDFGLTRYGAWWAPVVLGFALGLGALVGDAVKSYFKRKSGRPRGTPWVGPDQLDFVVGSLVFAVCAGILIDVATGVAVTDGWAWQWLIVMWWIPLFLVLATPAMHWIVNVIGYKLGLKQVPW